jgi:CRISPR-associated endoribonuclease Cas6
MRLVIRLRSIENSPYKMQYHYQLQGFIYNLLRGSAYDQIHDKWGYKFFCFSNIFPALEFQENDVRTLIVSSPDSEFTKYLYERLQPSFGRGREIKVANMNFKIDSLEKLTVKLPDTTPNSLITGTPIIVRIPKEKYNEYDFEQREKKYDYVYWRSEHPFDLFITQLENNLLNKYDQYHRRQTDSIRYVETQDHKDTLKGHQLFHSFKFKKQISTRVFMKGFDQVVIGTLWEFSFNADVNKDIIQFALDAGLGERNSLGFGFMNLL